MYEQIDPNTLYLQDGTYYTIEGEVFNYEKETTIIKCQGDTCLAWINNEIAEQ